MDEYVVYFINFNKKLGRTFHSGHICDWDGNGVPGLFADYPAKLSESYMLVNPNPN